MKINLKNIILLFISLLIIILIFIGASQDGLTSNRLSNSLCNLLTNDSNGIISTYPNSFDSKLLSNNIHTISLNLLIRKFAHYSEFLILSLSLIFLLKSLNISLKKSLFILLSLITTISISTETIQIFVPYRSPMIFDALINILGGVTGIILFFISNIINKIKLNKL